ncbi:actin-like protein arp8 [Tieghemiomyces parasiticus]|uniref:Actin-like protein arp8 n=1 Tax=Tieghemiomyces parasiticus TaxID=78921 RepID=A0A9W8AIR0_9FUNG|nr:actin-like protein arp8 [Tieghemiomyces parasiticus]
MSGLGLPRKRRYSWLPEHHPSAISAISVAQAEDGSIAAVAGTAGGNSDAVTPTTVQGDAEDPTSAPMLPGAGTIATTTPAVAAASPGPTSVAPKTRRRKRMDPETKALLGMRDGSPAPEGSTKSKRGSGGRNEASNGRGAMSAAAEIEYRRKAELDAFAQELMDSSGDDLPVSLESHHRRRELQNPPSPPDQNDTHAQALDRPLTEEELEAARAFMTRLKEDPEAVPEDEPYLNGDAGPYRTEPTYGQDPYAASPARPLGRDPYRATPDADSRHHLAQHADAALLESFRQGPPAPSLPTATAAHARLSGGTNGRSGGGGSRSATPSASAAQPVTRASLSKYVEPNPQLKFTTFPSYTSLGNKAATSYYLKTENTFTGIPGTAAATTVGETTTTDGAQDGSSPTGAAVKGGTIVIHPGSRYLRIGKSTDIYPQSIPHVVARRMRCHASTLRRLRTELLAPGGGAVVPVTTTGDTTRATDLPAVDPANGNERSEAKTDGEADAAEAGTTTPDPVADERETAITHVLEHMDEELRQRLKDAKRRPVSNALSQVISFNSRTQPETILDHNDPYKVEWTDTQGGPPVYTGTAALRIPEAVPAAALTRAQRRQLFDPVATTTSDVSASEVEEAYVTRWPIHRGQFNWADYDSREALLNDLDAIWTAAIEAELGVPRAQFRHYAAVLVIPDLYHRHQVQDLVNLLLNHMGFQRLLIQQESVCVTFGAGISSACIVDIGAQSTSAVCVEDGYCLPTTRVQAQYGGDDLTRAFAVMLERHDFPYAELNLNRAYDWSLLDSLKEQYLTLNEVDITVQVYDFVARVPHRKARKYRFKVYEEPYTAAMALFYPRLLPLLTPYHLPTADPADERSGIVSNHDYSAEEEAPSLAETHSHGLTRFGKIPMILVPSTPPPVATAEETPAVVAPGAEATMTDVTVASTAAANPAAPSQGVTSPRAATPAAAPSAPDEITWRSQSDERAPYTLLPLDRLVTHCISHAGPEDRCKRHYANIILVGGGGVLIPNFAAFLQDRLYRTRPSHLQGIEKIQVLPSPRDMDPRLLAWKGAAVLSKLEIAQELSVSAREWNEIGAKCFKQRLLFFW